MYHCAAPVSLCGSDTAQCYNVRVHVSPRRPKRFGRQLLRSRRSSVTLLYESSPPSPPVVAAADDFGPKVQRSLRARIVFNFERS